MQKFLGMRHQAVHPYKEVIEHCDLLMSLWSTCGCGYGCINDIHRIFVGVNEVFCEYVRPNILVE